MGRARPTGGVFDEVALLRPQRVLLCHHDDWLPGCSVPTDMAPIRAAFDGVATELLEAGYLEPVRLL